MANVNSMPEFKRGMEVVYNILKDGKNHTRATLKTQFAKHGIKKGIFGRCYRLGRILRAAGIGDVVVSVNREDNLKSTVQLVKGAQAKKYIAEKNERYANLAGSHTSKKRKPAKKAAAKKSVKKATAKKPATKKATVKKTTAKKPAKKHVAVTTTGSEEASDNEILES